MPLPRRAVRRPSASVTAVPVSGDAFGSAEPRGVLVRLLAERRGIIGAGFLRHLIAADAQGAGGQVLENFLERQRDLGQVRIGGQHFAVTFRQRLEKRFASDTHAALAQLRLDQRKRQREAHVIRDGGRFDGQASTQAGRAGSRQVRVRSCGRPQRVESPPPGRASRGRMPGKRAAGKRAREAARTWPA